MLRHSLDPSFLNKRPLFKIEGTNQLMKLLPVSPLSFDYRPDLD
jgi:hypothetical protein